MNCENVYKPQSSSTMTGISTVGELRVSSTFEQWTSSKSTPHFVVGMLRLKAVFIILSLLWAYLGRIFPLKNTFPKMIGDTTD